jgi:hypothetical protein
LRELFFRPPSARARQDAAPPEVARNLLNKHRVTSGGAASRRAAACEITENIGLFACFPLARSLAGGTPAPRLHIRFPPTFPCPRSGFHVFQCCHSTRLPAMPEPRSGIRDSRVENSPFESFLSAERFSSLSCHPYPAFCGEADGGRFTRSRGGGVSGLEAFFLGGGP